jgi:hypothetical protein
MKKSKLTTPLDHVYGWLSSRKKMSCAVNLHEDFLRVFLCERYL